MNMKIKIESTQLKTLLTEEVYESGFNKIQNGDMFIVNTDGNTYNGKVVDKYSTQIIVQFNGKNFIITSNSLDGDNLRSNEMVKGEKKPTSITKGVKSIIIRRNGNTVTTLTPNTGHTDRFGSEITPEESKTFEKIYQEVSQVLNAAEKDNKLVINTGTEDSQTSIEIHVKEIFEDDIILGVITRISGDENYDLLEKNYLKISKSESIEITDNGVVIMVKVAPDNKIHFIENVMELHLGEFFNVKEPTFDEMMQDKGFRDLMLKNPSLMSRISGEMAKGVIPANDIIKKLGLTHGYYTKGKKVKFTYTGQTIKPNTRSNLNLTSGKEYIGIFSSDRIIKLTGEKRGESLMVKLKKKLENQIYEVEVSFNKIVNGQQTTEDAGRGIIQITDVNFR